MDVELGMIGWNGVFGGMWIKDVIYELLVECNKWGCYIFVWFLKCCMIDLIS